MHDPYYFSHERPNLRYREIYKMVIMDPYNSHNRDTTLSEKVMNIINHYRTPNLEIQYDRCEEYLEYVGGRGNKNYNINRIKYFKDIPDGIEILIDYVDVTAIRTMSIPSEIIYESIYRELPELFEK